MIKAKKSLGQNFLVDKNIIEKIINSATIKDKIILEIGPGTGNLTNYILKKNPKSLYITETIGHGSNLVTGDYSVGATGFLVEDGEFKYPVNEITIAGNFKDMLKNITLANDLEFEYSVNSPTMMIEGMTVAGK